MKVSTRKCAHEFIRNKLSLGTGLAGSLVVLGHSALTAIGTGLIPGWGTKFPPAV